MAAKPFKKTVPKAVAKSTPDSRKRSWQLWRGWPYLVLAIIVFGYFLPEPQPSAVELQPVIQLLKQQQKAQALAEIQQLLARPESLSLDSRSWLWHSLCKNFDFINNY